MIRAGIERPAERSEVRKCSVNTFLGRGRFPSLSDRPNRATDEREDFFLYSPALHGDFFIMGYFVLVLVQNAYLFTIFSPFFPRCLLFIHNLLRWC